jgi:uncharacterized membrane protein YvbJ
MFCPKCGSNQGEGMRFCTVCGIDLPEPPQFPHGQTPLQNCAQLAPPPRLDGGARRNIGRIVGLINCFFGVLIVLSGIFLCFLVGAGGVPLIISGFGMLLVGILGLMSK